MRKNSPRLARCYGELTIQTQPRILALKRWNTSCKASCWNQTPTLTARSLSMNSSHGDSHCRHVCMRQSVLQSATPACAHSCRYISDLTTSLRYRRMALKYCNWQRETALLHQHYRLHHRIPRQPGPPVDLALDPTGSPLNPTIVATMTQDDHGTPSPVRAPCSPTQTPLPAPAAASSPFMRTSAHAAFDSITEEAASPGSMGTVRISNGCLIFQVSLTMANGGVGNDGRCDCSNSGNASFADNGS